jgi:(R,R)-butanediol dehydrogenase/meso-butanediol dehydrogenase/diacetyl reductase
MMRAACLHGSDLRIEDVAEPVPAGDELLVAVHHAGICGTDLQAGRYGLPDGFVLGHELSGEVVDVGPGGDRRRVGERVAVLPVIGCGECGPCRSGDPSRCRTYRALGVTTPGCFAELVVAGGREAFRLPDHVGDDIGALVEPLAIGLHVVQRARLEGLERALVIGAGPIGLAVTTWLVVRGITPVVVSDPVEARRHLALASGAHASIDPVREDVGRSFRHAAGHKPSVIFECAGGRLGDAIALAGRDTTIVVAGYHAAPVPVDTQQALVKEIDIAFASWYTTAEFTHVIDAVARDRLPIGHLITHRIPLDDLPATYAALKHPNDQGTVVIDIKEHT